MSMSSELGRQPINESSLRYPGWRIALTCFTVAIFSWGFGFYGQGVYLAELRDLEGWPASLVSAASTSYYLFSAILVVFVSDAVSRFGPKRVVLAGIACLGVSTALVGRVTAPWQLYVAYLLMSFGWAAMSAAAITTILGLWFRARLGLAISLVFNGAAIGGIVVTPVLVTAIERAGFASALLTGAAIMAAILVPMTIAWMGKPPLQLGSHGVSNATLGKSGSERWTRRRALGSSKFLTVSTAFAIALFVQVGFLVHQINFLAASMDRRRAGFVVAITAIMGVVGRLGLGVVVDRLDQRMASTVCFVSQTIALCVMASTSDTTALFVACAVYGLCVGNVVTLPSLIIHREFDAASFPMLVAFSTAIIQFVYALGPWSLGLIRDISGGYQVPLFFCAILNVVAAGIVLLPRFWQR